jgi:hypothetical protein
LRILGLAWLGCCWLLSATIVAHADPLAPAKAGAVPAIIRVWDGSGSAQHSESGSQHSALVHARKWIGGWVPRCWGPSGGWVPYCGPGVPIYWVWVLAAGLLIIPLQTGEAQLGAGVIRSQAGS